MNREKQIKRASDWETARARETDWGTMEERKLEKGRAMLTQNYENSSRKAV